MQIHKTVFISYRRTNSPIAQAIRLSLMRHGFDVFLDFDSINSGSFEQIILNQISARAHFLILLTPSALENCTKPDDWLRKEIEEAMRQKRNIVPLFFEDFKFENHSQYLKGDLLPTLPNYNGMKVHWDMFDQSVGKLCNRFLNIPNELVIHPAPISENELVEEAQTKANEQSPPTPEQLKSQEYFEKGFAKVEIQDFKGAIEDFTRAILFYDSFGANYNNRGNVYVILQDYEQALKDYDKAIELNPEHGTFYENRGNLYANLNNYELALADYNESIRLSPEPTAYNNRGNTYKELNDYEHAIEDYTKAIELNIEPDIAYNNRGNVYSDLENYKYAIDDYTKAIELTPENSIYYNSRGNVYVDLGDYEKALTDYSKSIELDPNDLIPLYNRSGVYMELKKYKHAINDLKSVLELEPELELAKQRLKIAQRLFNQQK